MSKAEENIEWLHEKINKELEYECMPENETGYHHLPFHKAKNIYDALVPKVKQHIKSKNPDFSNQQNKELKSQLEGLRESKDITIKQYDSMQEAFINYLKRKYNTEEDSMDKMHELIEIESLNQKP